MTLGTMRPDGGDQVIISGSFRPNGAGAPTDIQGSGWSVARSSEGLYTIKFNEVLHGKSYRGLATIREASGRKTHIQLGDVVPGSKTMQIRVGVQKGTIPLDLTSLREIATNDIQALAAHGGLLSSDSDPSLARVNGATDKALRVVWDTSNDTDEVQFPPVPWPHDLDPSSDVTVHLLAVMAGSTDTPTIDVQAFEGVGDTEMGGATAALSDTLAEVSVTLDAANITGHPGFLNLALVPGAHTTDALYLYAAWLEYTKLVGVSDLTADADNEIAFQVVSEESPGS